MHVKSLIACYDKALAWKAGPHENTARNLKCLIIPGLLSRVDYTRDSWQVQAMFLVLPIVTMPFMNNNSQHQRLQAVGLSKHLTLAVIALPERSFTPLLFSKST